MDSSLFLYVASQFLGFVEASKIGSTTRGIPTRSRLSLAAPFPFGIVGPTGDMGPVSQFMCVCVKT